MLQLPYQCFRDPIILIPIIYNVYIFIHYCGPCYGAVKIM